MKPTESKSDLSKQSDPFDHFEFKPLTEGLGFHKKADKAKKEIRSSNLGAERAGRFVPNRPPSRAPTGSANGSANNSTDEAPRKASQSISDLIASLPPSLDFLDDKDDSFGSAGAGHSGNRPAENPYVSRTFEQPKARSAASEKKAPGAGARATKRGGGFSSVFSTPTSDEILPSVSAAAANAASLFGELAGPRQAPASSLAKTSSTIAAQSGPQISSQTSSQASSQVYQALPREDYHPPLAPPQPNMAFGGMMGSGLNSTSASLPPGPQPAQKASQPTARAASAAYGDKTPYADRIQGDFARSFPHGAAKRRRIETPESDLVKVPTNFTAAALDAMVVTGFSAIFLVSILAITKADIVGLLANVRTDGATQAHLALLFAVVLNLYLMTARSFFGATLGEWAFDIQLGDGSSQRQVLYPLRALARSLAITLTGFVIVPLGSLIAGKDLAKAFSGLQLYRRP